MVLAVNLRKTVALVNYCFQKTTQLSGCGKVCTISSLSFCTCNTRKKKRRRVIHTGVESSKKPIRNWQSPPFNSKMFYSGKQQLPFRLLSYNVLAQDLLEDHLYLYNKCKEEHLVWEYRWKRILEEIVTADPDVICLQEVQESHLEPFFKKELAKLGYEGLYKKRTGQRADGVGLWYRASLLRIDVWSAVEFNIQGEAYLDRDNVAIVARLVPRTPGWEQLAIVVATTHLLYNTHRHDIKLAQTQLLLAECESLAYRSEAARLGGPAYWPVIITGDFNLLPCSGVYKFITEGKLEFEGLCSKTLTFKPPYEVGKRLGKQLISPERNITDNCQYVHEILARLQKETGVDVRSCLAPTLETTLQNIFLKNPAASEHRCISDIRFGTGTLTHPLQLRSAYLHGKLNSKHAEATTYQNGWCTVDYIFFSGRSEDNLKLAARYRLFTRSEAENVGPIPNDEHPSDHYPLMAHFILSP